MQGLDSMESNALMELCGGRAPTRDVARPERRTWLCCTEVFMRL